MNSQLPPTRPTLVFRLRDANDKSAWDTFVEIYAPVVFGYARRCGLQEADASDLVQEVLRSIYESSERFSYDAKKGSFRGWLFTIARNRIKNLHRKPTVLTGGTVFHEMMSNQADPTDDQTRWNRDHETRLFGWALEHVKPGFRDGTWEAFWRVAIKNEPAGQVAEDLGLTLGAVYIAKSRVVARLREAIQMVEGD